jgi:hypothetical protein
MGRAARPARRWRPDPIMLIVWSVCLAWSLACWWAVLSALLG